jgi:uncharacterized protein YaeQ
MSGKMLYRFEVELSDVDRGLYEALQFRVVQHPSETAPYLLTRIFAYILNYEQSLEFSPMGLGDPDAPALQILGPQGDIRTWFEIGNPSARKLHKASKSAKHVIVYTYKNADLLREEIVKNEVHRGSEIQIFALDSKYLQSLEGLLEKTNRWTVLHQQGTLDVTAGGKSSTTEVRRI